MENMVVCVRQRLYESACQEQHPIDQLDADEEDQAAEASFQKILLDQNSCHSLITELSSILNRLNSPNGPQERQMGTQDDLQDPLLLQLQAEVDQRPERLFKVSKSINSEFQRAFKLQSQYHRLLSDSKEFRKKYHELVNTALT